MSLRAIFLLLLFANLAFLGWAELIDAPPEPPPSDSISHLPQLKLLNEVRGTTAAPSPQAGGSASSSAVTTSPTDASSSAIGTSGSAISAGASGPAAASGARDRCITVGPFKDEERAREAMDLLRQRGFSPQARAAPSAPPRGYWVFIGGLKSGSDEARIVKRLEHNGISDAKAMPPADGAHRVSVGLFSERDGAERRARAVRRLGLDAEIAPRQADTTHWVDLDLDSSSESLPTESLLSLQEDGSRLEIKQCPAAQDGGNGSRGRETKGAPGGPKAPSKVPDFKPQIPPPLTAEGRPRPG